MTNPTGTQHPDAVSDPAPYRRPMGLIVVLLVIWLVVVVLGFLLKGLLWLAILGIVLFVVTAIVAAIRRRSK